MKNILKKTVFAAMAAALVVLVTGCPKPTGDDNGTSDPVEKVYTLTVDTEAVDLVVGGEAATVKVTTNGTYKIEVEAESVATATAEGDTITITPVAKGTTTIVVTSVEDSKLSKEIAVSVISNTMVLTLKLGDDIAIPGGSIVVKYGNGGDKDAAAYEYYEDATAVVAEDGKSATVELDKVKANEWGWFNGIIITVKDKDGNAVEVEYEAFFEFNADGFELALTKKVASTKTVTLSFDDFVAESVKVTYGNKDSTTTVDAVVAEDGKTATVEVSSEYKNNSGWMEIASIEVVSNGEKIEVKFTGNDSWFDFNADIPVMTYEVKKAEGWVELKKIEGLGGTGSLECVVGAGDLQKEITAIKVDFANMAGSGDWWMQISKDAETWDICKGAWNGDVSGYTATTEDAELIAAIKENGLYFVAGSGLTGNLIVSYK